MDADDNRVTLHAARPQVRRMLNEVQKTKMNVTWRESGAKSSATSWFVWGPRAMSCSSSSETSRETNCLHVCWQHVLRSGVRSAEEQDSSSQVIVDGKTWTHLVQHGSVRPAMKDDQTERVCGDFDCKCETSVLHKAITFPWEPCIINLTLAVFVLCLCCVYGGQVVMFIIQNVKD